MAIRERLDAVTGSGFNAIAVALAGLFWLSAAVLASAQPNQRDIESRTFAHASPLAPLGTSVAVADFDADGDADIARADRAFGPGRPYEIDLELTEESLPAATLPVALAGAIALEAIDIDHDRDIDLVVTPLLSRDVVGVFLNVGRGQFTPGDRLAESAAASHGRSRAGLRGDAAGRGQSVPDWPRPPLLSGSRSSYVSADTLRFAPPCPRSRIGAPHRTIIIRGPPRRFPQSYIPVSS